MAEAIINALSARDSLSGDEIGLIQSLKTHRRKLHRDSSLMSASDSPRESYLMVSGITGHELHTRDGARQLTSIYLPGEFLNLHTYVVRPIEHGVQALTDCEVVIIPHSELRRMIEGSAHLARLILLQMAVDGAIQRATIASLGRGTAAERLGRFFCEVYLRLRLTGAATDHRFRLDLVQSQIAELLGLSLVHVNRSLKRLREKGLLSHERRVVTIHDWERLLKECDYDGTYLNLVNAPR